ncbi:MAG: hypothetical protein IMF01_09490 [Proteobacteria bacterium]|nr:hypothetical protein [Pseudomonadota bacterium]
MIKHKQLKCTKDDCHGNCGACCLSHCSVCKCFEGALTTHCFGKPVDHTTQGLIYSEGHDFVDGKWIILDDFNPMLREPIFERSY